MKVVQEQVGHWRGSAWESSASAAAAVVGWLRDLRSQCLREKTGTSKKAQ